MGVERVIDLVERNHALALAASRWLAKAGELQSRGAPLPKLPVALLTAASLETLAALSSQRATVVAERIAAGQDPASCDRLWDALIWCLAAASESDLRDELEILARTDPLTGLLNRRGLLEVLARESARARRGGTPVSIVLLDLDHFKALNDTQGHHAGDQALRLVADLLRRGLRTGDDAGRWGGDEFAVVFAGLDVAHAHEVIDRLRATVSHPSWRSAPSGLTFSAGVVALDAGDGEPERLMEMADEALYLAKAEGGNRTRRRD